MIHTKLHVVKEILSETGTDRITAINVGGGRLEEAIKVINLILNAPIYCIDPHVVELLMRDDVERTILAIMQAGVARLPYSPMVIEFSAPTVESSSRYFIWLEEHGDGVITSVSACLSKFDTELIVMSDPLDIEVLPEGLLAKGLVQDDPMAWASLAAVSLALLMLNTKGIEKEVIHTDRLNKARAKSGDGRHPVPQHSIVRIGTIYDRSGRGHAVTATGRHMPVHLRAGHVRRQHFGKDNEEVKTIFIPPCIVNFRDESGDKPKVPHKTITI